MNISQCCLIFYGTNVHRNPKVVFLEVSTSHVLTLCCTWANPIFRYSQCLLMLQIGILTFAWSSNHNHPTCCTSNSPSIGWQWCSRIANNYKTDWGSNKNMFVELVQDSYVNSINWFLIDAKKQATIQFLTGSSESLRTTEALCGYPPGLPGKKTVCWRRPRGRQPWVLQRRAWNILRPPKRHLSTIPFFFIPVDFHWKVTPEPISCKFCANRF